MERKTATIIPALRYKNAPKAIDWLCEAFGFERHLVVPGESNSIAHAQLKLGNSMIMLGSEKNGNDYDQYIKGPAHFDGVNTQAPYIVIENIEEHYQTAIDAGAKILLELEDQDYGGKLYTCRDPEGHIWNFGSYDPWGSDQD